jgi:hypothetical protein
MSTSLALRQQLQDSIAADIAARATAHQSRIAALKSGAATVMAAGAPAAAAPLVMLAQGDSWFDYPLYGNGPLPGNTDIIAQLQGMGAVNPVILSIAHFGDATTEEMSLPKQQQMIAQLQDPANWTGNGKPDAILFSGGGDDIAGNQFCIYLDDNTTGSTGLDTVRFAGVLDSIKASYLDLFAFRDKYASGVPIFGHCYDFPIPNGVHPICAGPWLQPSLAYAGWTDVNQGAAIIRSALASFKTMLQGLAAVASNNFILVGTQGLLAPGDWANELHPDPSGFKTIAGAFLAALQNYPAFSGRI